MCVSGGWGLMFLYEEGGHAAEEKFQTCLFLGREQCVLINRHYTTTRQNRWSRAVLVADKRRPGSADYRADVVVMKSSSCSAAGSMVD